jgi:hypothetical protein
MLGLRFQEQWSGAGKAPDVLASKDERFKQGDKVYSARPVETVRANDAVITKPEMTKKRSTPR